MQLSLFHTDTNQEQLREIDVEQLFEAYLSCRKTKRYTQNALKFEVDYEANLFQLKDEIENGSYSPGRSIAFIVNNPSPIQVVIHNQGRVKTHSPVIYNKF